MLVLFRPWRTGADLKTNQDITWEAAFQSHTFSDAQTRIMANFNLRYECLDARDDYRAELMQDLEGDLPAWMDGNTYTELAAEGKQQLVMEDMADYGVDADILTNPTKHGRRHKARERQAAVIRNLMDGCKWSSAIPSNTADHPPVDTEPMPDKSPLFWKSEVDRSKAALLESRRNQDVAVKQQKSNTSRCYIDQVEIVRKKHLVRSQHDESDDVIVSRVEGDYGLNEEQQRAFRIVSQHSSNPAAEQLKMYIGGMGGMGKTWVLNALTAYFKEQGESRRLVVVAPTGSAAALVKGSTYHFMFGINECHGDTISRKALAEFKERLEGVDYVFLDEVSMLSCVDMYRISAHLAMCLNRPELPFGGMNMIFAGDFAQLPPAIGSERASLYGPNEELFATSKKAQEMAMGKAIWHQVTTVVILRQNMRQRFQTAKDEQLRTALANMRYKACTKADIAFLNSRISGKPAAPKIADKQFRNVSIITGLNVHKDELNRIASARFTEETRRSLVTFYSEDQLSSSETSECMRPGQGKQITCTDISQNLQDILWAAAPSENDKHIPPTLALCIGMPVMIRVNSATELCITKGQEATVHSWRDAVGSRGQRILDVLFVTLINPPTEVRIPGLPLNVVPLLCTSSTITCSLPDDMTIRIARSQVEILHNFAMTDYSSQGKTRPFNPVDLNNCRSHQSYYTALSRTATAEGTLILLSLHSLRSSPVDAHKIQGGCSGYLRQEFRELETLDDITTRVYNGSIPITVQGDTRYTLIESFREHMGPEYVPARMDTALMWSEVEPFKSVDATLEVGEWPKTLISHKPKVRSDKNPVATSVSVLATSKRVFTPMKPPEKRKGRTSEMFDLKQSTVDNVSPSVQKPNMFWGRITYLCSLSRSRIVQSDADGQTTAVPSTRASSSCTTCGAQRRLSTRMPLQTSTIRGYA
ncbi:uncharacterized protein ARMOST_16519 [Armillaria ostoyae]|uniref:ATP-dependent DNA helicase n=1 Tax=Armillaria ostoyae TaxID=47428 RepID=A0A284RWG2_ARMOS|nr:uncharacterized protein ARMOST_16519 [Armillaria ostoyae]